MIWKNFVLFSFAFLFRSAIAQSPCDTKHDDFVGDFHYYPNKEAKDATCFFRIKDELAKDLAKTDGNAVVIDKEKSKAICAKHQSRLPILSNPEKLTDFQTWFLTTASHLKAFTVLGATLKQDAETFRIKWDNRLDQSNSNDKKTVLGAPWELSAATTVPDNSLLFMDSVSTNIVHGDLKYNDKSFQYWLFCHYNPKDIAVPSQCETKHDDIIGDYHYYPKKDDKDASCFFRIKNELALTMKTVNDTDPQNVYTLIDKRKTDALCAKHQSRLPCLWREELLTDFNTWFLDIHQKESTTKPAFTVLGATLSLAEFGTNTYLIQWDNGAAVYTGLNELLKPPWTLKADPPFLKNTYLFMHTAAGQTIIGTNKYKAQDAQFDLFCQYDPNDIVVQNRCNIYHEDIIDATYYPKRRDKYATCYFRIKDELAKSLITIDGYGHTVIDKKKGEAICAKHQSTLPILTDEDKLTKFQEWLITYSIDATKGRYTVLGGTVKNGFEIKWDNGATHHNTDKKAILGAPWELMFDKTLVDNSLLFMSSHFSNIVFGAMVWADKNFEYMLICQYDPQSIITATPNTIDGTESPKTPEATPATPLTIGNTETPVTPETTPAPRPIIESTKAPITPKATPKATPPIKPEPEDIKPTATTPKNKANAYIFGSLINWAIVFISTIAINFV